MFYVLYICIIAHTMKTSTDDKHQGSDIGQTRPLVRDQTPTQLRQQ
jgi:hypothetical protein